MGCEAGRCKTSTPKSLMLMEQYERMKAFEEVSFKMLVRSISVKSKEILQQHMPLGKIWRCGVSVSAYQANTYISVATQSLFAPILECFNCISRSAGIELICRCVTVYIKNWMDYILEEQILFSYFGCQQLLLDFQHLLQWFENDSFSLTLDELNEIQSLDVIRQMRGSLRSRYRENERSRGEKKKNPLDKNGEQLRCNICESIYHFVRDCPDYVSGSWYKRKEEIKLQFYTENILHTLVEETH